MDFKDGKSIFLQIADSITDKIVAGEYKTGEKIPSVRELAAAIGVNPNTIMRTYSELQTMGIIENQRGIGYFISQDAPEIILTSKKKTFFDQTLPELLRQASLLGITADELQAHIKTLNQKS